MKNCRRYLFPSSVEEIGQIFYYTEQKITGSDFTFSPLFFFFFFYDNNHPTTSFLFSIKRYQMWGGGQEAVRKFEAVNVIEKPFLEKS